jgi:hypothetical protein
MEKKEYTVKAKFVRISESVAKEKAEAIKRILSTALLRYKEFKFLVDNDEKEVLSSEKKEAVRK